ncbi:MAG: CHRD domain-containing protein [Gaiellaceae bacterium]
MTLPHITAAALVAGLMAVAGCGGDETDSNSAGSVAGAVGPVMIELAEQNGSGQTGTATFTAAGPDETRVVVEVTNPPAESQPVHIHRGSCEQLDPDPLYGLPNLMNGRTEATVPASIEELTAGGLALNAHRSDEQLDLYVACGNLPGGSGAAGTETNDGDGY